MSTAVERFEHAARDAGLSVEVVRFPEGTKTAAAAARAIGCTVAQIVKSLVFMAGQSPVVALTSGANRADTARLEGLLGVPSVRRATPEEARTVTSFAVGGTPPLGYPTPVTMLMDEDLLQHEDVWAAAGTPDTVWRTTPDQLLRATGARPAAFKEE